MTTNQKTTKQFIIAATALFLMTASANAAADRDHWDRPLGQQFLDTKQSEPPSPAHAETLTMICGGYSVAFLPGSLTSHAPKKDRDYPITKVDRQNGRTIVSGKTQYGKITAFFSKDGRSSIVWTNGKDVVLNQCASETVLATQPPLQERRSEADASAEDGDAMLRNRPTETHATSEAKEVWPKSWGGLFSKFSVAEASATEDVLPVVDVENICKRYIRPETVKACIEEQQPYYDTAKFFWPHVSVLGRKACSLLSTRLVADNSENALSVYPTLGQCLSAIYTIEDRERPSHFQHLPLQQS